MSRPSGSTFTSIRRRRGDLAKAASISDVYFVPIILFPSLPFVLCLKQKVGFALGVRPGRRHELCEQAPRVCRRRLSGLRKAGRLPRGAYRPVSRRKANRSHPAVDDIEMVGDSGVVPILCSFPLFATVPSVAAATVYEHRDQHVKPTGYGIHHSAPIMVSRSTMSATTDPGVSLALSTVIGISVLLPSAHSTNRRYASVTATGS